MCDNCARLEKRIEELRIENIDLEDRRSRERSRNIAEQHESFMHAIDTESVPKRDFVDLLELLQRVIERPDAESLTNVRSQLEKYIV